jgi:hypothetical protein
LQRNVHSEKTEQISGRYKEGTVDEGEGYPFLVDAHQWIGGDCRPRFEDVRAVVELYSRTTWDAEFVEKLLKLR